MAGLKSEDILNTPPGLGSGTGEESGGTNNSDVSNPQEGLVALESLQIKSESLQKNLNILSNHFEEQSLQLAATPTIWPTKGWVTSTYGWRNDPFTGKRAFHRGLDIATHYGNPVLATADGVVIQTSNDKIGGKTIKISHRSGFTTVYCHLSKFLVRPSPRPTGEKRSNYRAGRKFRKSPRPSPPLRSPPKRKITQPLLLHSGRTIIPSFLPPGKHF